MENEHDVVSSRREERSNSRIQVRAVCRRIAVRTVQKEIVWRAQMKSLLRLIIFMAAAAIALAPLAVIAQTKPAPKPWTPPKTPWGDPDIQGLWPGQDMVGTPLERDRSFGTRAFLTDEEFAKKVAFSEEQSEIDTAEYVNGNPRIARGGRFVTCEEDPNRSEERRVGLEW